MMYRLQDSTLKVKKNASSRDRGGTATCNSLTSDSADPVTSLMTGIGLSSIYLRSDVVGYNLKLHFIVNFQLMDMIFTELPLSRRDKAE